MDIKDFFLYKTELPMDSGFDMFGVCHWFWMIGIGIFSWWMGKFFSFAPKSKVKRIEWVLGIIFPLLELTRTVVLIMNNVFVPYEYPLHLCNLSLWIGTIYIWTKNCFAGVVYILLCLPAAALAIVFPGWLQYPFWNYMHIHNFIYHGLVVALGWSLVQSKELVPVRKELWKPLLFGVVGYGVIFQVNKHLGTNFWFINKPSYGSPLAFLYELLGDEWYLVGHFLFCGSIVLLWFGLIRRYQHSDDALRIKVFCNAQDVIDRSRYKGL